MELPKVIIKENFEDFLQGKEVEATVDHEVHRNLDKGTHVLGYHNSVATTTPFPVPKEEQPQYIGVEGMVTATSNAGAGHHQTVKVVKV